MEPNRLSIVSGGFDPMHVGHVRMIREARRYGPVVVILNSDEWLIRKKGFRVSPYEDRREVLAAVGDVYRVVKAWDFDGTVSNSLETLRDQYPTQALTFCNGGDRLADNTPETDVCAKANIAMVYGIGGGKIESSSRMVPSDPSILNSAEC